MSKPLPIYETFYAWQGEGCHMGRAAFFIRTFGCPVKCPWCDSAGTWHPDWIPEKIEKVSAEDLAESASKTKAEFVVLTGGEPTIHDLQHLTDTLHEKSIKVHLETSGAFQLKGDFDWITLSPKWARLPLQENIHRADELKIIVEDPDSIPKWVEKIGKYSDTNHIWLHPEWSGRENPEILNAISDWVKTIGPPYRAGFQVHRLFNVDALDARSQKAVPLGGDVKLGY